MKRSRTIKSLFGCVLAVGLLFGAFGQTFAEPVLDQSFLDGLGGVANGGGIDFAQTFTVGIEGTLAQVDLDVVELDSVTLQIRPTIDGVPAEDDNTALLSVALPDVDPPPGESVIVPVDVSAFELRVTPGEVLAIVLLREGRISLKAGFEATSETYPDGAFFLRFPGGGWMTSVADDLNFQTWVEPDEPVPATAAPGVVLLVLIVGSSAFFLRRPDQRPRSG